LNEQNGHFLFPVTCCKRAHVISVRRTTYSNEEKEVQHVIFFFIFGEVVFLSFLGKFKRVCLQVTILSPRIAHNFPSEVIVFVFLDIYISYA
jgi:hypothetical protein